MTPRKIAVPGMLLIVLAAACQTASDPFRSGEVAPGGGTATLLLENRGSFTMAITTDASPMRLGTVPPGETDCLLLQTLGSQRLIARPTGGGGEGVISPRFNALAGQGWRWEIGSEQAADGRSLSRFEPCDPA